MRIVITYIIVLGLCHKSQGQGIPKHLLGSWQLVEELRDDDGEDLPSIMAVPESEKPEEVEEVRDIQLHFSKPNLLRTVDSGIEYNSTFQVKGSGIILGNREYKIKSLTRDQMILEEQENDLSLSITTLTFDRISNSKYVRIKKYEGLIFDGSYDLRMSIENQKERYTPTIEDVALAEQIIQDQLKKLPIANSGLEDCPIPYKNLKKYARQYFGFKNIDGDRILWINMIWEKGTAIDELAEEAYIVLDGCSYYWNVKINIDKSELFDLIINGVG